MRSTSCTISTIAVLTGAGTPPARAASTTAPLRKSISVSCPRRMLCSVEPGFGTDPIRRASSRGNAAPAQSGTTPIELEHPPRHALHRPEPHAGRTGDAHRLPHARRHHLPQPVVGDDVLHAHPRDRGERVDVVDEQLRPLRALDVVRHLHRKRASQHARHAIQYRPRRRRRSSDHQRILAGHEHLTRPDVGRGEQREPAEQRGRGAHAQRRRPARRGRSAQRESELRSSAAALASSAAAAS